MWFFCKTIRTKQSIRKPDVVILPWEQSHVDKTVSETDHRVINSTMTPAERPLWPNVLASIEFKRQTRQPSPPPTSYNVKDYVHTKPDYRRVEPPVADAPATTTAGS